MTTVALLAPGPSLTEPTVARVRELVMTAAVSAVGCVTSAFPRAPWADFLAANDGAFWRKFDGAHGFAGRKFSTNDIQGVERFRTPQVTSAVSSGVLALEVARVKYAAMRVLLFGFDHHGSHYFGAYTNLANTPPARRAVHAGQFNLWARMHPEVAVVNCTPGSALTCFPMEAPCS